MTKRGGLFEGEVGCQRRGRLAKESGSADDPLSFSNRPSLTATLSFVIPTEAKRREGSAVSSPLSELLRRHPLQRSGQRRAMQDGGFLLRIRAPSLALSQSNSTSFRMTRFNPILTIRINPTESASQLIWTALAEPSPGRSPGLRFGMRKVRRDDWEFSRTSRGFPRLENSRFAPECRTM